MAVLDLSVKIPDDQFKRVLEAFKYNFGAKELSDKDIAERLRQEVMQSIRDIVITAERAQAIKAAEELEPTVDLI